MSVSASDSPALRRPVPGVAWGWLACWALVAGVASAIASVPAYRLPWTLSTPLHEVTPGFFRSDPIAGLHTPYISFARVTFRAASPSGESARLRLVRGTGDDDAGLLHEVTLASQGNELEWRSTAWQLRPVAEMAGLVNVPANASGALGGGTLVIGYDGRSPAVRVVTYWWPWLLATFVLGAIAFLSPGTWPLQQRAAERLGEALRQPVLLGIITLSTGIRLVLVWRGGQYFDWDESRYLSGIAIFDRLSTGNVSAGLDVLFSTPDHPLFRLVALVPAFFQVVAAFPTGNALADARHPAGEWLAASVLALASVVSIVLTYGVARRAGGSRQEGLVAAALMAASSAMLIHARHFFPYDAAMATALLALWIGLAQPERLSRSFAAGALGCLAFLIYTGYWLIAAVVVAIHVLRADSLQTIARRTIASALGFSLPLAVLVGAAALTSHPLARDIVATSTGITSGVFVEGWLLPWAFLWYAEPAILLVILAGIGAAIWRHETPAARRAGRWLLAAAAIYAGLVIGANVLQRFVVYDRLARQMLPFLCLGAAAGWTAIWPDKWKGGWQPLAASAAAAALFAFDAWPLLRQQFPREIVMKAVREYGAENVAVARTVLGASDATAALFLPVDPPAPDGVPETNRYVVLNGFDIWPESDRFRAAAAPPGEVLDAAPHPRQLRSLQYQGFTPTQREYLRGTDVSIRVIDTHGAAR